MGLCRLGERAYVVTPFWAGEPEMGRLVSGKRLDRYACLRSTSEAIWCFRGGAVPRLPQLPMKLDFNTRQHATSMEKN